MTGVKAQLCGAMALAHDDGGGRLGHRYGPGSPVRRARRSQQIKFMADWLPNQPTQGPFWEAQLRGYYKDEGLEVDIANPPTRPIRSNWRRAGWSNSASATCPR